MIVFCRRVLFNESKIAAMAIAAIVLILFGNYKALWYDRREKIASKLQKDVGFGFGVIENHGIDIHNDFLGQYLYDFVSSHAHVTPTIVNFCWMKTTCWSISWERDLNSTFENNCSNFCSYASWRSKLGFGGVAKLVVGGAQDEKLSCISILWFSSMLSSNLMLILRFEWTVRWYRRFSSSSIEAIRFRYR